jgi:hypothetical protein
MVLSHVAEGSIIPPIFTPPPNAHPPVSTPSFRNEQHFLPTASSFPFQEKPLRHPLHTLPQPPHISISSVIADDVLDADRDICRTLSSRLPRPNPPRFIATFAC